jgi:hypothetical protein
LRRKGGFARWRPLFFVLTKRNRLKKPIFIAVTTRESIEPASQRVMSLLAGRAMRDDVRGTLSLSLRGRRVR